MLKLLVLWSHDQGTLTSTLASFPRDNCSTRCSKLLLQGPFGPDPPYFLAKRKVRNNYPPSARCNVHVEVWCAECGVRRVACGVRSAKCNVHVYVYVYMYVYVYVYVHV